MTDREAWKESMRAKLAAAGLSDRADALLSLVLPSIRLHREDSAEIGPRPDRTLPRHVPRLIGVTAVAAGWNFTVALMDDGSVAAWGKNGAGQLGDGTRIARIAPDLVRGLVGVTALAVGMSHCLALRDDGSVLAWGSNGKGELGDGTLTERWMPVPVVGLRAPVIAIAAGVRHNLAVLSDGQVVAWGENFTGELGSGMDDRSPRPTPLPVRDLSGPAVAVAGGSGMSAALMDDGSVQCWGGSIYRSNPPQTIAGIPGSTISVAATSDNVLALQADGSVWTWSPERTPGAASGPASPVQGLEEDVEAIASGTGVALALRSDGSVLAWGRNSKGQLGNGSIDALSAPGAPAPVHGLDGRVRSIAAGWEQAAVAMSDGSVRVWGGEQPLDAVDLYGADPALAPGTTKLGGRPDLAAGVAWPSLRGTPQAFVAQLNLSELAPLDAGRVLPSSGLLSFFYDVELSVWGFDPADQGGWHVMFTPADSSLVRLDFPPELPSNDRFPASRLRARADLTLAPSVSRTIKALGLGEDEWQAYHEFTELLDQELRPTHRVLGHPQPVQGDMQLECQLVTNGIFAGSPGGYGDPRVKDLEAGAQDWLLLYQADSDDDAGFDFGLGRLYYWIRSDDLVARRFEKAWFVFQCT